MVSLIVVNYNRKLNKPPVTLWHGGPTYMYIILDLSNLCGPQTIIVVVVCFCCCCFLVVILVLVVE